MPLLRHEKKALGCLLVWVILWLIAPTSGDDWDIFWRWIFGGSVFATLGYGYLLSKHKVCLIPYTLTIILLARFLDTFLGDIFSYNPRETYHVITGLIWGIFTLITYDDLNFKRIQWFFWIAYIIVSVPILYLIIYHT